jgi:hypothetical protein
MFGFVNFRRKKTAPAEQRQKTPKAECVYIIIIS